jgi:pyruvate dehydrogenase E1 component beta subunit
MPAHVSISQQYAGRRQVAAFAKEKKEILMWEALRMATDEEMEKDPTVCVMGAICSR